MSKFDELRRRLAAAGQEQLLRFWDELDDAGKAKLAAQLDAIDFEELRRLIGEYVVRRPVTGIPADLAPAKWLPRKAPAGREAYYGEAVRRGEEALREGRVAFLTVAGGQGTRLGYNAPKGTYPIGPVSGRSLFAYFAGTLKRAGEKYGRRFDWYVMTSTVNRAATEAFFEEKKFFGLAPEQVFFFTQGSMPAIGSDGKVLLAAKDSLALSPDGHGGTLLALRKSGALDRMKAAGVEVISYFQVDNPLAPLADPLFIGLHLAENSDMSAIMLPKTGPEEKLGNFCVSGGRLHIIEYSDLPAELGNRRNPDGSLMFLAGSPAIHMISRAFIESLTASGTLKLPWHRADKKIPCLDEAGNPVTPSAPNGVKLESFIFDALPLAPRTMLLEGVRAECFAPTKNATGVDSVESCRAMLVARDLRRLEAAGVKIPRAADGSAECLVEIAPEAAIDDGDVARYVADHGLSEIASGARIVLE